MIFPLFFSALSVIISITFLLIYPSLHARVFCPAPILPHLNQPRTDIGSLFGITRDISLEWSGRKPTHGKKVSLSHLVRVTQTNSFASQLPSIYLSDDDGVAANPDTWSPTPSSSHLVGTAIAIVLGRIVDMLGVSLVVRSQKNRIPPPYTVLLFLLIVIDISVMLGIE